MELSKFVMELAALACIACWLLQIENEMWRTITYFILLLDFIYQLHVTIEMFAARFQISLSHSQYITESWVKRARILYALVVVLCYRDPDHGMIVKICLIMVIMLDVVLSKIVEFYNNENYSYLWKPKLSCFYARLSASEYYAAVVKVLALLVSTPASGLWICVFSIGASYFVWMHQDQTNPTRLSLIFCKHITMIIPTFVLWCCMSCLITASRLQQDPAPHVSTWPGYEVETANQGLRKLRLLARLILLPTAMLLIVTSLIKPNSNMTEKYAKLSEVSFIILAIVLNATDFAFSAKHDFSTSTCWLRLQHQGSIEYINITCPRAFLFCFLNFGFSYVAQFELYNHRLMNSFDWVGVVAWVGGMVALYRHRLTKRSAQLASGIMLMTAWFCIATIGGLPVEVRSDLMKYVHTKSHSVHLNLLLF